MPPSAASTGRPRSEVHGVGGMRGSPEVRDLPGQTGKERFMKGGAGGELGAGVTGRHGTSSSSPEPHWGTTQKGLSSPSGTDFRASRTVSYWSLSLLLCEMGKQDQPPGATVKVQS